MIACRIRLWFSCILLIPAAGRAAADESLVVAVSPPLIREITDFEDFSGRAEPREKVEIRARVSGYLRNVAITEGSMVKKGDLLFEIDARPYRAELEKAEADVRRCEARLKRVTADVERARALQSRGLISREEIDRAEGDRAEAEAACQATRASLQIAKLNLDFTRVTAPIDGRIGRPALSAGNVVTADTTALATLVSVDPMLVMFDVDERTVLRLARMRRDKPAAGESIPVTIALVGDKGFPTHGRVDSVAGHVDPATGTQRWRAVVANAGGLILPGMFARVRLPLGESYKALLVPERAVALERGEPFVLVVNAKDVVERRPVVLGKQLDGLRVIREGLTATDRVMTAPPKGVRAGDTVKPKAVDLTAPPGAK